MRPFATLPLLACLAAPGWAAPVFSHYEARLEVESLASTGSTRVHLLAGGVFGSGGLAHGLFQADASASTVNTLWLVQTPDGARPPGDERILSFSFDDAGNYLGIDPTPFFDPEAAAGEEPSFRIFLAEYPPDPILPGVIGELDFSNVSGVTLGSLVNISGVRLVNRTDGGSDLLLDPFAISSVVSEPAALALLLAGLAAMSVGKGAGRASRTARARLAGRPLTRA